MPAVDVHGGEVDLAWYASAAPTAGDPAAVWRVVHAHRKARGSTTRQAVVPTSCRVGAVCMNGAGCSGDTHDLGDYLSITHDPAGHAVIAWTADTDGISTWVSRQG